MVTYPQHSLAFNQTSQLLLTFFSCSLTPKTKYPALGSQPSPLPLPEQKENCFFFTPLFSSFSPLIFPCLHLSFNLKTQKKLGEINGACSPTLQTNCTGSHTTSKKRVQITSFIILTPIFPSIFSLNSSLRYRLHLSLLLFKSYIQS